MVEPRKVIVFLFVFVLLIYSLKFKQITKIKVKLKTYSWYVMFIGVFFIAIASFLDMISPIIYLDFLYNIINFSFTIGAIVYIISIILLGNYVKKVTDKYYMLSIKDSMTGAYNRSGLYELYNEKIKLKSKFIIVLCDLDGMKKINDTMGHSYGDNYIMSSIKIIQEVLGNNCSLARIGGDEFIVLLDYMEESELKNMLFKINEKISNIFEQKNTGVSIGYSIYSEDAYELQELIEIADKKMYEQKRKKHSRV